VTGPTLTIYEAAGGEETFSRLIERFYTGVAGDPVLRPLYPGDEKEFWQAAEHLRLFLIQYWGGPAWYDQRRGHPRLRLRHAPFAIGPAEREAWLSHMRAAIDSLDLPRPVRAAFLDYFERAATAMMNRPASTE
jgi:hemoglobin